MDILKSVFLIFLMILNGLFFMGVIDVLIGIKKKWWAWAVLLAACYVIAAMIIYVGDMDNLPPTLLIFLSAIWISCKGSGWKKITIGVMIASCILSCNALNDNFIIYGDWYFWGRIGRFLFSTLLFLGTKYVAPDKDYELAPSMWKLLLFLTAMPLGIVLSVILLSNEYWTGKMHFVLLTISLISFVGLLWTVTVLAKQKKLEEQNMLAKISQKYYETMEQQHFEIRRLKHDLGNHLQTLLVLPEQQKEEYIRELLENTTVTKTLNYCGDSTVNAVLTVKESLMRQKKIRFQRRLDIGRELPFEKADICALYANALDNAIEACEKLKADKREIILESRTGKGMLVLKVKNPCLETDYLLKTDELPKTSKRDVKNHGFGLQSMKEIVKRYGGEMEINMQKEQFELFLYIPTDKSLQGRSYFDKII